MNALAAAPSAAPPPVVFNGFLPRRGVIERRGLHRFGTHAQRLMMFTTSPRVQRCAGRISATPHPTITALFDVTLPRPVFEVRCRGNG